MKKILLVAVSAIFISLQSYAGDQYVEFDVGTLSSSNTGSLKIAYGANKDSIYGFVKGEIDALLIPEREYMTANGKVSLLEYAIRAAYILGFPIANNVFATGKLGLTVNHIGIIGASCNADADSLDLIYGVGVTYEVNHRIALNMGWETLGQFKAIDSIPGSNPSQIFAGIAYSF